MKSSFLSLVSLFLTLSLLAQSEGQNAKQNSLRFNLGLDYMESSNRHLSALNAEGGILELALSFERWTPTSLFTIHLSHRTGTLESSSRYYQPNYQEYTIGVAYLRSIWSNEKWNLMTGGALSGNAWIMQYNITSALEAISLVPSLNLDFSSRVAYLLSPKSTLTWSAAFGLLSKVKLQPYSSYDEYWTEDLNTGALLRNSDVMSLPDIFRWSNTIAFQRSLSSRLDIRISLLSTHSKIKDQKTIAFQSFGIQTSVHYKF